MSVGLIPTAWMDCAANYYNSHIRNQPTSAKNLIISPIQLPSKGDPLSGPGQGPVTSVGILGETLKKLGVKATKKDQKIGLDTMYPTIVRAAAIQ